VNSEAAPRREATADEAKAVAHPLRIRILQVLRGETLTNKEIAERLGSTPGATLHHLQLLTEHGFATAEPVRSGARNAREIPYRATGKTLGLTFNPALPESALVGPAILDSALENYRLAPDSGRMSETSVTLYLSETQRSGFQGRLAALISEYAENQPGEDVQKYGFFSAMYRADAPAPDGPSPAGGTQADG
jgi:DNA-binding transcriptional ArsR family regulator